LQLIKITKGFDTWQEMVEAQEDRINEMGIKFLLAETEKDDPIQLHVTHLGTHWYSSNIHRVLTGSICCVNLHAGITISD